MVNYSSTKTSQSRYEISSKFHNDVIFVNDVDVLRIVRFLDLKNSDFTEICDLHTGEIIKIQ